MNISYEFYFLMRVCCVGENFDLLIEYTYQNGKIHSYPKSKVPKITLYVRILMSFSMYENGKYDYLRLKTDKRLI